eukprot:ANDGO_08351.mRNA.1 hypothetical protein
MYVKRAGSWRTKNGCKPMDDPQMFQNEEMVRGIREELQQAVDTYREGNSNFAKALEQAAYRWMIIKEEMAANEEATY